MALSAKPKARKPTQRDRDLLQALLSGSNIAKPPEEPSRFEGSQPGIASVPRLRPGVVSPSPMQPPPAAGGAMGAAPGAPYGSDAWAANTGGIGALIWRAIARDPYGTLAAADKLRRKA